MNTTERKASQGWVLAAGGLVVIGLAWIVINITTQTPELPVFGMLLFGAGIIAGLIGLVMHLLDR